MWSKNCWIFRIVWYCTPTSNDPHYDMVGENCKGKSKLEDRLEKIHKKGKWFDKNASPRLEPKEIHEPLHLLDTVFTDVETGSLSNSQCQLYK